MANPLGMDRMALRNWMFGTRTFERMFGKESGVLGMDDDFAARGFPCGIEPSGPKYRTISLWRRCFARAAPDASV
jgi:hypothetical protein